MTLWLHCHGGYPSYKNADPPIKWNDTDYAALNFVRAIKRDPTKPVKSSVTFTTVNGNKFTVSPQTPENAFRVFAEWAVRRLQRLGKQGGLLVPVPSSATTEFGSDLKGMKLVESIAKLAPNFQPAPVLAWHEALPKTASSGNRSYGKLVMNLKVDPSFKGGEVILVDDVATTHNHLKASATVLRKRGASVELAICVAQTVLARPDNMWGIPKEDIEADFDNLFEMGFGSI